MAFKVVFLLALFGLSTISSIQARNGGFSVNLFRHDSPKSPFYNPEDTHYDRLRSAIRRSIARVNNFKPSAVSPNEVQATVIPDGGEYLMSLSLGTPPVELLAIADTGSDLLWTQCKPCEQCYQQDAPLFNPSKSSTYRDLSCEAKPCEDAGNSATCTGGKCFYEMSYGDQSFSNGNLATETLTLASTTNRSVAIPKTVFGCGHNNDGTFHENGTGIVGLGGGPLSLITQLGSKIEGKFSYCLAPLTTTAESKLNFGDNAVVSGEGAVSTPLVAKDPSTFYYLTLEGISVGDKKLLNKASLKTNAFGDTSEGNIIIDSGTTLTLLPSDLYDEFESSIKKAIHLEPIQDPQSQLQLCYKTETDFKIPLVTAHFTGADVVLQPKNTFVRIQDDIVCLALVPSNQLAIFGNIAQMDFLVGYDTKAGRVSFKPTDCTQ